MKIYTDFYVNTEEKTVICKIVAMRNCHCVYKTIIGRAVCQPEDTFDEVIGRRIAETKAHIKLHKRIRKDWYQEYERLMNEADEATKIYAKETDILINLYDKLAKLKGND